MKIDPYNKFRPHLEEDEKILWTGGPKPVPFFLNQLSKLPIMLLFPLIFGFLITIRLFFYSFFLKIWEFLSLFPFFFWIIIIGLSLHSIYYFSQRVKAFPKTKYALTNKRVLIRFGRKRSELVAIPYRKIRDVQVTRSFVERNLDVGTLQFDAGRKEVFEDEVYPVFEEWHAISFPDEVHDLIRQYIIQSRVNNDFEAREDDPLLKSLKEKQGLAEEQAPLPGWEEDMDLV